MSNIYRPSIDLQNLLKDYYFRYLKIKNVKELKTFKNILCLPIVISVWYSSPSAIIIISSINF